jgi:glycosyltransferase involved in cell wall biosynthesis
MVGDGDQKNEAVQMISQLNLNHKITLESFRQDVPDVLASADIFVLPSLWEVFNWSARSYGYG